MANTWKKGNFGLSSLEDLGQGFDNLIQSFNDNLDGNYTNVAIPSDETFTDVSIPSDATYTDVSKPSVPTYTDQGVNT